MSLHNKLSPFNTIIFYYSLTIAFFSAMYSLPASRTTEISVIDLFFLSASALSATGLSSIDIVNDLTTFGKFFLLVEIQLGGIGIMIFIAYLFFLLGKDLSVPQLLALRTDQNQRSIQALKTLVLLVSLIAFVSELIGFLIVYPIIHHVYDDTFQAIFVTIFHSVSSFTNSGFDLFGNSLFSFKTNSVFILTTSLLIILGAIGFPTIIEFFTRFRKKKSLYFKINIYTHLSLIFMGFIIILISEFNHSFQNLIWKDKLLNAFFTSVTARNAGFTTTDINLLSSTSVLLLLFLIFIGTSSNSAGGGIRTTTFALILANIWSLIRGKTETVLFNKSIYKEDLNKAHLVLFTFLSLSFVSILVLSIVEPLPLKDLTYEVISSITTAGISTGITSTLHWFSKLWLILLMIIGRVGVITFIYLLVKKSKSESKYIKESVLIG